MPESNLHKLSALGQSVWIDNLSRDKIQTGELERLMREDAVVGVTSNPTIFQKAIAEGTAYDDQLREILDSGEEDLKEIFLLLSSRDVSDACDLLRKVWDKGHGLDGYVSWEVDPNLAYDREGTIAQRREDEGRYRVEVRDEIALGQSGGRPEGLVQVRRLDPLGHGSQYRRRRAWGP